MANEESTDNVNRGLEALRTLLAEAGKTSEKPKDKAFSNIEAAVAYSGKKIVLPDDPRRMELREAREWLNRLEEQENTTVQVIEPIKDVHPFDGAVAFMRALKEIYNWASPVPTPGFFGPQPPVTIAIETGPEETAVIFWGGFKVPGLPDVILQTQVDARGSKPVFQIVGTMRRKYVEPVHQIAELTRKIARESSIYRGQALRLNLTDGEINWQQPPTFMNLSRINPAELVLASTVEDEIQTNLWTMIEHTARCRQEQVPLKRGVLLEGQFGVGKTMAASITAVKCVQNNWTFIIVPETSALEAALHFGAAYQPCVIFVEDVDRQMKGERDAAMDAILNTVDGVASKGTEIMVCYTSNAANLINRAMMRPGRLDAVIHMAEPDGPAVQKLLRVYGRNLLAADEDLTEAGKVLAGRIPAVIRECVERSKLYAISKRPHDEVRLTGEDIIRAARGMEHHLNLLNGGPKVEKTTPEIMADALRDIVTASIDEKLAAVEEKIQEIHQHVI